MVLRRRGTISIVILAALAIAAVVIGFPAAAAITCPVCYGFERLTPSIFIDIFVERTMSPNKRAYAIAVITKARQRVQAFYGRVDLPYIFICESDACYHRLGGKTSRGNSFFDFALILSGQRTDQAIAAHELAHIELHRRIGFIRFVGNAIPAWFDEGLAVVISDDPRYLAITQNTRSLLVPAPDRCLARSHETLLDGMSDWNKRAGEDHQLYAKAACRVSEWLARNGGSAVWTGS
jgi:hypothetical protein